MRYCGACFALSRILKFNIKVILPSTLKCPNCSLSSRFVEKKKIYQFLLSQLRAWASQRTSISPLAKISLIRLRKHNSACISNLAAEWVLSLHVLFKTRLCAVSSVERDLVWWPTIHVTLKQTPAHQNLFSPPVTEQRVHHFSFHLPFQGGLWLGDR